MHAKTLLRGRIVIVWIVFCLIIGDRFVDAADDSPLDAVFNSPTPEHREELMTRYRKFLPPTDPIPTPEQRDRLLRLFLLTENPAVVERLGLEIIIILAEKFRAETLRPNPEIFPLRKVLEKAIDRIEATEEIKTIGRAALKEGLSARNASLRVDTISYVARQDKADSTKALLKMIDDADESVRIAALDALGEYGTSDAAPAIAENLRRRSGGLSEEEIRKDYSFRHGHSAIERIAERFGKPQAVLPSPGPSPRMATPAPSLTQYQVPTPAKSSPPPPAGEDPAATAERKSTAWLWLVGIAGLVSVGVLVWRRRV